MTSLTRLKTVERNKRYLFISVEAVGVICTIALTPLIGIPVMATGAYLGWKWFEFRLKNGMRF